MSTAYNGLYDDISYPALLSISSSTNTSPITVTTSTPHGRANGDYVHVFGHQVNTNANGRFVVTVTGASTLQLNGTAGIGIGGATGNLQPVTFHDSFSIPSDGDLNAASSVNAALETLGDRSVALLHAVGAVKLVECAPLFVQAADFSLNVAWATLATVNTSWTAGPLMGTTDTRTGDLVEIDLQTTAICGPDAAGTAPGTYMEYSLGYSITPYGGAPGAITHILGSGQLVGIIDTTHQVLQPINCKGMFVTASTGTLTLYVGARRTLWSNTNPITWAGNMTLVLKRYRGNPQPQ